MNKSKSIVKQASILALAGILVRIIGVLYRSPLTALIGDEGNGYYSTAYNIYAMVLLISSYSIPTAISKLISEKLALRQYNNARKIFKCALIYIVVVGGSAALLTFILAPWIVTENAVFALRILCPTIFLSGLVGVLRGYFQAYSTTVYTSVSQIIEQMLNAVVSVGAAYLFIQPYANNHTLLASRGAGGSALGTGFGVLVALIYMVCVYLRKGRHMIDETDADPRVQSGKAIFRSILNIVTPIIISTCIYNLVSTIDMFIFYGIMQARGVALIDVVKLYGVYAGKFVVLMNVPVALASAMSTATIPAISSSYALKDLKEVRANIKNSTFITMLILIPAAVGMGVLAYPVMGLIFPQPKTLKIASTALTLGAPAIVLYGLSTLSNGILQAIGAVKVPLRNAAKALVVHVVILVLMLVLVPSQFLDVGIYLLVIGTMLYALQMCISNQYALNRLVGYHVNFKTAVLLPLVASILMAACAYGSYYLLFKIFHRVFIPLILAIIVGVVVYFFSILFIFKDHLEMLSGVPYVDKIIRKLFKNKA